MTVKRNPALIQTRSQLEHALANATLDGDKEITILAKLETEDREQGEFSFPSNAALISQIQRAGITVHKKAFIRLINKSKRSKWFKVEVDWQYEKNDLVAQFKHAGDAYDYATHLQDESVKYGEPLYEIRVEC